MSSATNFRIAKRSHQACENCRRKKTRCPGEKPVCSNCSRLRQNCTYSGGTISVEQGHDRTRELEERLAQLEEKMEMMEKSKEEDAPQSVDETNGPLSAPPSPLEAFARPGSTFTSLLPPREEISRNIQLYFHYCHRQPICLFDESTFSQEACAEELLLSILAVSMRFEDGFEKVRQSIEALSDATRSLIMLRIANGTVEVSTLQSLCLLAFANFVAQDIQLAWFHIGLAKNLWQCSNMEIELKTQQSNPALDDRRRIFWSLRFLEQVCGLREKDPLLHADVSRLPYMILRRGSLKGFEADSILPAEEPPLPNQEKDFGIWAYMVQMTQVWNEVRSFILHSADDASEPPWSPESQYTIIGAWLMDMETSFPLIHRYDSARFTDRSKEEIQKNRHYWSPWLMMQFLYHTIHCILNHPFLHSSRHLHSTKSSASNSFWRASTETALLHTTWICRMIDMVKEKDFQVSDPLFGHCAAICATLHMYYSRAADPRLRTTAQANLTKCRSFIGKLAVHWPICQKINENLDKLLSLAPSSNPSGERNVRAVSINKALMRSILDYASPSFSPQKSGYGIFSKSISQESGQQGDEHTTVETPILETSAVHIDTSDGGQAPPPNWFNPITSTSGTLDDSMMGENIDPPGTFTQWSWPEGIGFNPLLDISFDSITHFYEGNDSNFGRWEFGNL